MNNSSLKSKGYRCTQDDDYADDVEEKCLMCEKIVKLSSFLRSHVEVCRESKQLYEGMRYMT